MEKSFQKLLRGYRMFRDKYVHDRNSVMSYLAENGQNPEVMVVSCCDSRVDPGIILHCDPGDLFVIRNVANIVPPYICDEAHHGTSAALEFGVRSLKVKHLILFGHSQCGGIKALLHAEDYSQHEFLKNWVSVIDTTHFDHNDPDGCAKSALKQSYQNCFTFPWIKERVEQKKLIIHQWFFDIKNVEVLVYHDEGGYLPLDSLNI